LQLIDRAIQAFEMSISQRGPVFAAHRWLSRLYKSRPGGDERSAFHLAESNQSAIRRKQQVDNLRQLQEQARQRARLRNSSGVSLPKSEPIEPRTFIIVSGLPRSGTSLMMQMLKAGGVQVMTDNQRTADHDNPEGYFEWEDVKRIGAEPELLSQADGKAVKIVSALIPALPSMHYYRVIFMQRPIDEVVVSQKKMIDRRRTRGTNLPADKLAGTLAQHRSTILRGMTTSPNFEVLEIDYPDLVANGAAWAEKVNEFLGQNLNTAAMAACVKPDLHRNRAANTATAA
jgi:hypothetical protein